MLPPATPAQAPPSWLIEELNRRDVGVRRGPAPGPLPEPNGLLVWKHCDGKTTVASSLPTSGARWNLPVSENIVVAALADLDRARLLEKRAGSERKPPLGHAAAGGRENGSRRPGGGRGDGHSPSGSPGCIGRRLLHHREPVPCRPELRRPPALCPLPRQQMLRLGIAS